ncbi:hypothetical protein [Ferviditalea candida]|uniref:Uncharacterized protein n=1 Tax=Ferviditalea candida TaxID=3108399 RepID=A0ABU5ZNM9_9BACL|nr:hypothetical protein [Paenibacillaceae bacterium T2]
MNDFDDINRERNGNGWIGEEGVLDEDMEVDSDVNEDRNREQQLDASFQDWYRNIESWVKQKEDMTQVPKANVFDAAVNMDADQEKNK